MAIRYRVKNPVPASLPELAPRLSTPSAPVRTWTLDRRISVTTVALQQSDGTWVAIVEHDPRIRSVASTKETAEETVLAAFREARSKRPPRNGGVPATLFIGSIEVLLYPEEDGYYAEVPSVPGAFTEGDTVDETMENVADMLKQLLEARLEMRAPMSITAREARSMLSELAAAAVA